jgi:hypothetical protein
LEEGESLGPLVAGPGGALLTGCEADLLGLYERLRLKEEAARSKPRALAEAAAKAAAAAAESYAAKERERERQVALKESRARLAAERAKEAASQSAHSSHPAPTMMDRAVAHGQAASATAQAASSAPSSLFPLDRNPGAAEAAAPSLKRKVARPGTLRAVGSAGLIAGGAAAGQGRPQRSLFDKGERHAELPAEFVVWGGSPDWMGELADDALEVKTSL